MIGRKMKPVSFSAAASASVKKQLGVQEVNRSVPKSNDPINFPVWEIPVNKKALCYVPNHTIVDDQGVEHLRMDIALIHSIEDKGRFYSYRCVNGIEDEEAGLNGECPLCTGSSEPWDLANLKIESRCRQAGLDPEDIDNPQVKNIRSAEFNYRALKDAVRYFTFPIVVFETLNDDGKTFLKDENGNYKYRCYWYNISETQYEDKWRKTLDAMDNEPNHPGGHFFLLNYTYNPKHGEPNKRDSARALQVNARSIKNSEAIRELLDKQTEEWTPEKAWETVISNAFYSVEDLRTLADEVLESTRQLIAVMKAPSSLPVAGAIEGGDGFALEKRPTVPENTEDGSIPLGDTDDDYEM